MLRKENESFTCKAESEDFTLFGYSLKTKGDMTEVSAWVDYKIVEHFVSKKGNDFILESKKSKYNFRISALPGYMVYNAVGAIIASLELGLSIEQVQQNILRFKGMVRRFETFKTKGGGVIITDYGH